ncbi:hypothetical protein NCCP1664_13920 [Zafaria cholistanensis]|uniref:DUF1761 domain-containing protein n=1 Tax=Zafaria cholistanensis TaxID=1682741 RepID=A0A5A7NQ84_9MICC|nr:DUF1761 domain-containing protein [Zafaria cholistanensis]GER22895.1 hypothetical protein NCCP1664_13920 [Zafaria cholistanensis]
MLVPAINFWAVLAATLSAMVVGFVWYMPQVFGNYWRRTAKVAPSGEAKAAAGPILVAFVASFVSAWVLAGSAAIAQHFYGGNFLVNTFVTGVILWTGFTAARFITHDAFEGRPVRLTVLNCAHELVTVLAMCLVIGLFGI